MLLASLIESNGDVQVATRKLCQGISNTNKKPKHSKSAARAYRREMNFVGQLVSIEYI